jgi:hypothetical protein
MSRSKWAEQTEPAGAGSAPSPSRHLLAAAHAEVGQTERAAVDARIWLEGRSDGMSNRSWPYAAPVRIDSLTYRGCAESLGEPGVADAVLRDTVAVMLHAEMYDWHFGVPMAGAVLNTWSHEPRGLWP